MLESGSSRKMLGISWWELALHAFSIPPDPVWSNNSSSLAVSATLKVFAMGMNL